MKERHYFKIGQRVQLSREGKLSFIRPFTKLNSKGTVKKIKYGFPVVLWDDRKTTDSYHPDFLEPVSR